ncbi:hypothetical protein MTO96_041015 [Rhipicephalus appendiculatus]
MMPTAHSSADFGVPDVKKGDYYTLGIRFEEPDFYRRLAQRKEAGRTRRRPRPHLTKRACIAHQDRARIVEEQASNRKVRIVEWDKFRKTRDREKKEGPIEDIGAWCKEILADVEKATKEIEWTDWREKEAGAVREVERHLEGTGLVCAPNKSEILLRRPRKPRRLPKDVAAARQTGVHVTTKEGGRIPTVSKIRVLGLWLEENGANSELVTRLRKKEKEFSLDAFALDIGSFSIFEMKYTGTDGMLTVSFSVPNGVDKFTTFRKTPLKEGDDFLVYIRSAPTGWLVQASFQDVAALVIRPGNILSISPKFSAAFIKRIYVVSGVKATHSTHSGSTSLQPDCKCT